MVAIVPSYLDDGLFCRFRRSDNWPLDDLNNGRVSSRMKILRSLNPDDVAGLRRRTNWPNRPVGQKFLKRLGRNLNWFSLRILSWLENWLKNVSVIKIIMVIMKYTSFDDATNKEQL